LAVAFSVALWVLRMATGDRAADQTDLFNVLAAIDRAQGYASLSGPRHRSSFRTIAKLGELPRLVTWYVR